MLSCEPMHSYKVPLRSCGQSVIEHNLVTIYLSLDWPENAGDNPNLVIHVLDKKLPSPVLKQCKTEPSTPYFPQNPSASSLLVNGVHHQSNLLPTYHQQQHIDQLGDPPSSTTTITGGDHNDVSSTTTVVFSGGVQQQPLPSHTSIQQIKTEPKTQLSPLYRRHPTPNSPTLSFNATCSSTNHQQYLPSQHVIQTPPSNSDPRSGMQMSPSFKSISPTASTTPTYVPTKQTSPVMTHVVDLQQAPTITAFSLSTPTAASTLKAVVCSCLKPNIGHEHSCPALTLTNQQSVSLVPSTVIFRQTSRDIAQAAAAASQMRTNRALSMTPTKIQGQPLVTTPSSSSPFLNCNTNLLKTTDSSSTGVTTIISQQQQQQPSFINNTQSSPTVKLPRIDLDNNNLTNSNNVIYQQSGNFPLLQINSQQQTNYQPNPPAKKAIARQRSVGSISGVAPASRQRRKRPIKQNSLNTQSSIVEQNTFHTSLNLNDSQQQQTYFLQNSPSKQPSDIASLLTNSIQVQQQQQQQQISPMYMMKEEPRIVTNVPLSATLRCQAGDTKVYTVQPFGQNPPPPVKLMSPLGQNSVKQCVSQFEIDRTIDDVVSGKGDVSVSSDSPPTSSSSSSTTLIPLHPPSSHMVWIQNGTTTTTWFSPLQKQQPAYDPNGSTLSHQDVVNIAQQVVFPPDNIDLNNKIQTPITNSKKRNRSKSTTNIVPKRIRNRKIATNGKSVTAPSSQQEITGRGASPITPTLNLINKPIVWTDSVTTTSSNARIIQQQHSAPMTKNDLWHVDAMLDSFQLVSDDENQHHHHQQQQQRTYSHQHQNQTFDFDLSIDGLGSSTPPPPPSFAISVNSQVYATSSSTPSLSTSKILGDEVDVYEQFLNPPPVPRSSSSSSTWQENQVTSSVSTPPDHQTNNFLHHPYSQHHYSQVNDHLDSVFQAQTFSTLHISSLNNSTMFNHLPNNDFQTSLFSSSDQQQPTQNKIDDYGDVPLDDDLNEYLSTSASSSSNSSSSRTVKRPVKVPKPVDTPPGIRTSILSSPLNSTNGQKSISKQPTCTRCGTTTQQVDITHHEFPAQKGLIFECMSCGNNSMKSNVSDDERRRRVIMAAADHLNIVDCHFCGRRFHSTNDYLMHLRNDHGSNTPLPGNTTR